MNNTTKTHLGKEKIFVFESPATPQIYPLLEFQPYQILRFSDPEQLIQAIDIEKPDLLIVDHEHLQQFPGQESKLSIYHFPVIRVSDKTDIKDRLAAVRDGCVNLMPKPLKKNNLLGCVSYQLKGEDAEPYRILMIDDDEVTLEYQAALLEQAGLLVRRLATPMDCLDVLSEFQPELILLDVDMPDINGIELSRIIRQIEGYNYIPIIFLSSESDIEIQEQAMQYGGEYFISKPVNPERFKVSIKSRAKYSRKFHELNLSLVQSKLLSEHQQITLDEHAIVSITNIEGDITYVNDKFCAISGYDRQELLGRNHRILRSVQHDSAFYEDLWQTISTGKVWHGEICNLNKEKNEYWVESTIVPFIDESGLPYQYVSVRTDITDLRRNEQRLTISQRFANIGTWDWDIQSGDLYWSERIGPLFGYQNGKIETTYDNFLAAIHPDDRDKVTRAVADCVEHNKKYDIEHRVVWQDGSVHWLHETGNVSRDREGQPMHMLGVVRDITLQKTWQKQLAASEQRMRAQLDSMSEGLFGLTDDGRIAFVNQAASVILGYSQDNLIGKAISSIQVKSLVDDIPSTVFRRDEKNAITETEFKCIDDAYIPVEYSSMPILSESGVDGAVVTFKDITERKRVEKELVEAKELAEKANKAKSHFLSSMSHELRTPMNAIIGFSQLLLMDRSAALSEMQKDNISEILRAGEHLLELINEVLDLSKIEAGQVQMSIEPVDLLDVMSDSLSLISSMAEKNNITINLYSHDKAVTNVDEVNNGMVVLADRLRLKQVLLNLISNAIKYNSENGSVSISCSAKNENICVVEIKDTGIGISEADIDNLFQPFNRLEQEKSEVDGTGIGLVITKNLIEMMGGEIYCESEKNVGTSFTVELSLYNQQEKALDSLGEISGESGGNAEPQYNLLYIEDNPANVRLMAQVFSSEENLHLSTVHEPILGLSLVAENKPDLILLDINLPGMNGYKVLEQLRKLFGEDYPVIAVSANSMQRDIEKGFEAGFTDYITKPIDVEALLKTVNTSLKLVS